MIKKELRIVNVEDLKPYDGNPRRNNQSAKIVAKSIQTYGYINPIVVTDELVVLAGHTRLKALKLLGYTQIDVLVVHGLTKEQIDGFVIADNRVGEFSQWNYAAVERMLKDREATDLEQFGMYSYENAQKEMEALLNE